MTRPLLIAPSILINFGLSKAMQRRLEEGRATSARVLLILGIAFNCAFLGCFKYANFFVGAVNDVFGTQYLMAHVVLPLGISFITFQKIAFLVDVHSRRIEQFTLQDYGLFVLFFPQLIAGPIVRYRDVHVQIHERTHTLERFAEGVRRFVIGMGKKMLIANICAGELKVFRVANLGSLSRGRTAPPDHPYHEEDPQE